MALSVQEILQSYVGSLTIQLIQAQAALASLSERMAELEKSESGDKPSKSNVVDLPTTNA